jgi:hypothetical protein
MAAKQAVPPVDAGLQQIAEWEAWLLDANWQRMADDGLDADTIAREWPAVAAMVAAVAEQKRVEYRARTSPR